jgi:recombination protein U
MGTWKSRGLRGSTLEELVNVTNETYLEQGLALIQKIPTPITPVQFDKEHRHITLAYFEQKSTVDYIGVIQGIPVCFDAKECATDTFPLQNIHPHQVEFMGNFEKQEGIAFFLLYFTDRNEIYYLTYRKLLEFWKRAEAGGRKSFRYEELDPAYFLEISKGYFIPYLNAVQLDLDRREQDVKNNEH